MTFDPFLSLIVPAYNEAQSIRATLADFQAYLDTQPWDYQIIVSADGNDGTREIVAELARQDPRLGVLGSPERGGKGRGIRLAMSHCRGRIIGFADADNKTPIEELDRILPCFDEGYDVVIGSRGQADSRIERYQPLHRRIGSRGFWIVRNLIVGLWGIRDSQCGFKFFRAAVARDLFSRQRIDGYMFDVEILHLAQRAGYRLKEVGVRWRDDGDSRLDLFTGNLRNVLDLFRIRFGNWRRARRPVALAVTPEPVRKVA